MTAKTLVSDGFIAILQILLAIGMTRQNNTAVTERRSQTLAETTSFHVITTSSETVLCPFSINLEPLKTLEQLLWNTST